MAVAVACVQQSVDVAVLTAVGGRYDTSCSGVSVLHAGNSGG